MGRKTLAAVLHEYNKPLSLEYIDLEPGPGEAIINVKASGVCGRDIVIWRGGGFKLNPPLVLGGHEVFGELNDKPVGGVYGAVTCGKCDYCRTGRENLCNELTFLGEGSLGGDTRRQWQCLRATSSSCPMSNSKNTRLQRAP